MSPLKQLRHLILGEAAPPKATKEDLETIAEELAKRELKFSDDDIKRIAHNIVDLDRDADRLAARIIKLRSFWIPLIVGLFVTGVLGSLTVWRAISSKVEQQITNLTNSVQSRVTILQTNVQNKLESTYDEVTNNISVRFQERNIQNVIVSVASTEATNILLKQVNPVIAGFENQLTNSLQTKLNKLAATSLEISAIEADAKTNLSMIQSNLLVLQSEATAKLKDLQAESDLYRLIATANAGDRAAFGQLFDIQNGTNAQLASVARLSVNAIIAKIPQEAHMNKTLRAMLPQLAVDPWGGTTNTAANATFSEYVSRSSSLNDIQMVSLLRELRSQERFPLDDRLAFIGWVAKFYNRLAVVEEACSIINDDAKYNLNLLGADQYAKWVEDHTKRKLQFPFTVRLANEKH